MKFTYNWNLKDLEKVEKNNLKVFSCFACGGGSTMGYKMSGFDVLGCNEIDPKIIEIYKKNHKPKYAFNEPIQEFKKRKDLPKELYNLDILDGSPPCSSFSICGNREKDWGKKKKFAEGQALQVLDDLFFHFIDLANELKPKLIIAENVKGIIQGKAKGYTKKIIELFNTAGYQVQIFLLNSKFMGVPQARERVFFICSRKDLELGKIFLNFSEKPIRANQLKTENKNYKELPDKVLKMWQWLDENNEKCGGKAHTALYKKRSNFNIVKLNSNQTPSTLTSKNQLMHWAEKRYISEKEIIQISSFPKDYDFCNKLEFITGMSVPPLMMHKISKEIHNQWFKQRTV